MSLDIGPILEGWPPGEGANARKIVGDDGQEKMQLRVVIEGLHGIVQFNCDGRPDGKRPHAREFALDHYEDLARARRGTDADSFRLSRRQAAELFEESAMTYQRYVLLLQMNDYDRVIRDTERNMRLFRFVHACAARAEDRDNLEKWWPYILRLHWTARALKRLEEESFDAASACVAEGRKAIVELAPQENDVFQAEMKRSIEALDDLDRTIGEHRPLSEVDELERDKEEAIRAEDYERAAQLRDRIVELRKGPAPPE